MCKIYCCVVSMLFFVTCFSGYNQDAAASDGVRYTSNRVKIMRPEKIVTTSVTDSTGTVVEETTPTTVATVEPEPVASSDRSQELQVSVTDALTDKIAPLAPVADVSGEMSEEIIREEVSLLIGKKEKFYTRKGRIDPFEPFLRKPAPEVITGENVSIKRRTPRTPLEKIDLSQLSLTAVLRTSTKTRALVEEASGKGYVINEGTYIGNKGGQVSKIYKDRILVDEKYLDVFGKISVRERELKLQQ